MKAFLTSIALILMFATGTVAAGSNSYGDEAGGGCSHQKWEDT